MSNKLTITSNITKKELDLTQPLIVSILVEGQTDFSPEETSTKFAIIAKYDGNKFYPQNEQEQKMFEEFPNDIAVELNQNFDEIVRSSLENKIFSTNSFTIQTSIETEESIEKILEEDQWTNIKQFSHFYFDKHFSKNKSRVIFNDFVNNFTQFITATQLQNRSENEYSQKQITEIDTQLTSMRNIMIQSVASDIGRGLNWDVNGENWTPTPVGRITNHIKEALSRNIINDGKKFIINNEIKHKIYSDLNELIQNDKALNYGILLNTTTSFKNNYQSPSKLRPK